MNIREILNKKENEKIILNENPLVELTFTGNKYDFLGYIENNTGYDMTINFTEYYEKFCHIKNNDWVGLFIADIDALLNNEYEIIFE